MTAADQIIATVQRIPRGAVSSYGRIADLAGLPGRARMVGRILRDSTPDRALPWHRVLRSDGRIAFPAESRQAADQIERLAEEGVEVRHGRVDLSRFGWSLDAVLWGPGAV